AVLDDILRRLASKEEIHDYEARLLAKDGTIRHVAMSSNALFDDDKFVHTRCFTRDITGRKRIEEWNEFLLDATMLLGSTDRYETRLQHVATLAASRLGGACVIDLMNENGAHEQFSAPVRIDMRLAASITAPMRAGDRSLGSITLVAGDTRRRYSQQDEEFLAEFARRTAIAVDNARHYRTAEEANRAKDQFLATLSHELRTPLTAILGWSRMLKLGNLDQETVRTAIDTIERSATSQAAIIDDLLDLSRVVTGKLTLNNDLVDLAGVVENTVNTLQLAADSKKIAIDVRGLTYPGSSRLIVLGDATRLQQILWNLVSNAIKFSDAGGKVTIAIERSGGDVRVFVRDTGRGISPEFLPHVFEPFRQADGATTRSYTGLGLGLAIVKYLAEAHGGSVHAASEGDGKGATFTVTLPVAKRRDAAADATAAEPTTDLRDLSVLLVDDDADTRDLVSAILRSAGADVHAADSVRRALEMLEENKPHVIVSDIAMPREDGFVLLGRVREAGDDTRAIPIIALTASGEPFAEEHLRGSGFDGYVRKPLDPAHLVKVIADLRAN
ncbi:MAG TPA: ATP-binding protein, partial [Thermoanaerobaculia bacterium]